jgi:hypothetical protein
LNNSLNLKDKEIKDLTNNIFIWIKELNYNEAEFIDLRVDKYINNFTNK